MEVEESFWHEVRSHLRDVFQLPVFSIDAAGRVITEEDNINQDDQQVVAGIIGTIQCELQLSQGPTNAFYILRQDDLVAAFFTPGLAKARKWIFLGPWSNEKGNRDENADSTGYTFVTVSGLHEIETVFGLRSNILPLDPKDLHNRVLDAFTSGVFKWAIEEMAKPHTLGDIQDVLLSSLSEVAGAAAVCWLVPSLVQEEFSIQCTKGYTFDQDEQEKLLFDQKLHKHLELSVSNSSMETCLLPKERKLSYGPEGMESVALIPVEVEFKKLGAVILFVDSCSSVETSKRCFKAVADSLAPFLSLSEGQEQLSQLLQDLSLELNNLLQGQSNLRKILSLIATHAKRIVKAGNCTVWIPDETDTRIVVEAATEGSAYATRLGVTDYPNLTRDNRHQVGVTGFIAITGQAKRLDDVQKHWLHKGVNPDWPDSSGTRAYMGLPFRVPDRKLWAIFRMESDKATPLHGSPLFTEQDFHLAQAIARIAEMSCALSGVWGSYERLRSNQMVDISRQLEIEQTLDDFAMGIQEQFAQLSLNQDPLKAREGLLDWATSKVQSLTRSKLAAVYEWCDKKLELRSKKLAGDYEDKPHTIAETIQEGQRFVWDAAISRRTKGGDPQMGLSDILASSFVCALSCNGIAAPIIVENEVLGVLTIETNRVVESSLGNQMIQGQHGRALLGLLASVLGSALQTLRKSTELSKAHKDLEQTTQELERQAEILSTTQSFLSARAHDAIHPIEGALFTLKKQEQVLEDQGLEGLKGAIAGARQEMEVGVNSLRSVMENVVNALKVTVGTTTPEMGSNLQSILSNLKGMAGSPGGMSKGEVKIQYEVDGSLPSLAVRDTDLDVLFGVFIDNALKFMPKPDGYLRIFAKKEDHLVKVVIEDNGTGMSEEKCEQFKNGTILGGTGNRSGLGAMLAQQIVSRWGLEYEVRSSTNLPDTGTTITIGFPRKLWKE